MMWEMRTFENPFVTDAAGWTVSAWQTVERQYAELRHGADARSMHRALAGHGDSPPAWGRRHQRDHENQADFSTVFQYQRVHAGGQVPLGTTANVPKSASRTRAIEDDIAYRILDLPGCVRLQFRGELFKHFNQVNFIAPNTTANSPNFGRTPPRCAAHRQMH